MSNTENQAAVDASPTTPTEVADFLDSQGTPGQSVTDRTVRTLQAMRLTLGPAAAEELFQLGRIEHFDRHLAKFATAA